MAKRLKTRLSAGAALVTGIGMMGIATAAPAQAAPITTQLYYTCTAEGAQQPFSDPWTVNLEFDVPDEVQPGAEIAAPDITANITPGQDAQDEIREYVEDEDSFTASVKADYTFGDEERTANLTVEQTPINEDQDVTATATGTGHAETAPDEEGEINVAAGDFTAAVTTGGDQTINISCAAPDDSVGSIPVSEDGDEPTENDWFTEPESLPITDDEKHFTVEGTATQDGVMTVQLLDGNKNTLRADEWNVTEGSNTKDFPFAEGTDYVRLVSQDCVDANGNTGEDSAEVEGGNGCNVEYYAPWVNPDGEDGDDGSDDAAQQEPADEPEVPEVVQTDGFQTTTSATTPAEDNALALTLGGLLLAGAGAGTVLVARRRAASRL